MKAGKVTVLPPLVLKFQVRMLPVSGLYIKVPVTVPPSENVAETIDQLTSPARSGVARNEARTNAAQYRGA